MKSYKSHAVIEKVIDQNYYYEQYEWSRRINGVFTGIFTCQHVACEDAGWAMYSQLRLHLTDKYNRQPAGISSQTTEYVARHPVYTQPVHSYSRSQKLEISSV